ncbi:thioredoxin family protein [Bacteroidales bacterium OttesenSCG-928-J16]|nr:thioredoxin family protein [Bacteroidales bacterium OttesenSCG-928-J16]
MKKIVAKVTILWLAISPLSALAQTLEVSIPCSDTVEVLYLYDYWGENRALIDTAHRNGEGKFRFSLKPGLPTGLFSLQTGRYKTDIILNNKEKRVELSFCPDNPLHTMKSIRSIENAVYYDFLRVNEGLWQAVGALESAILRYPREENFFDTLAQKYQKLQEERITLIEDVERLYPDSYAAKLASVYRTPFLSARLSNSARSQVMREDFFYKINMADTALLRSDAYIEKAGRYLEMFTNPNASYEDLQIEMITAIDKILAVSSGDQKVLNFMAEYFFNMMAEYGFTMVVEHLSENWMSADCDDPSESRLQTRMRAYQNLTAGSQAPSFAVRNQEGEVIPLEKIPNDYTLIVFYASTCSHCRQLLPKIVDKKRKMAENSLEVIAISIDEDESEWERYISTNPFEWINVREAKIWDGSVVAAYGVYATPMMFLLDKSKKIVAKPNDWSELRKELGKLGM